MSERGAARAFLDTVVVDPAVWELRPDYRAVVMIVEALTPHAGTARTDELLTRAEEHARARLDHVPAEEIPHIAAWREAYRAFGAKPQRTRNSLEALMRRAATGLPRVNALTDIYNAISVLHELPVGGEDLDRYTGAARLVRASGDERFLTTAHGEDVVEHPDSGEVVWRDDAGVTCRRWNWRQGTHTALSDTTQRAFFILDVLDPMTDDAALAAASALAEELAALGGPAEPPMRLIGRP